VRVFRLARGRQKGVFNKTYTISGYVDFLTMMGDVRTMLWGEYVKGSHAKHVRPRHSRLRQPISTRKATDTVHTVGDSWM